MLYLDRFQFGDSSVLCVTRDVATRGKQKLKHLSVRLESGPSSIEQVVRRWELHGDSEATYRTLNSHYRAQCVLREKSQVDPSSSQLSGKPGGRSVSPSMGQLGEQGGIRILPPGWKDVLKRVQFTEFR